MTVNQRPGPLIIQKEGLMPRFWMVADGSTEALAHEAVRAAIEEARIELKRLGVTMKTFPHDPNLPDNH